jgi:hypothetical protein
VTIGLQIVIAWTVAGLICATVVATLEIRSDARKGKARRGDDLSPVAEGILMGVIVPFVIIALVACGLYKTLEFMATKLARVDRLPEVQARKTKQADAIMEAMDSEPATDETTDSQSQPW